MIDVYIWKTDEHYTEVYAEGHAGYAEAGKDIVCAAVSALTITFENALNALADVPVLEKQYIGEKPRMFLPVASDKTDLLFKMYQIGIEGIQEAFPNNVKLHLET
ncbi:ribosomal-processing cysteine protease Prp [Faecalicatena contorta]|uniref:ribosomal-processing cysteine protease Prp n=1 Tax=Faecalicatena contorta TaxID=39482 RepID=UPI00129EECAF|nr:ribosomal-processing cysteine protease Prp [Faecalicatena contorta]MRM91185.1 ribosomal-processing cysteine protease Prp [Faecalicatena contorta]